MIGEGWLLLLVVPFSVLTVSSLHKETTHAFFGTGIYTPFALTEELIDLLYFVILFFAFFVSVPVSRRFFFNVAAMCFVRLGSLFSTQKIRKKLCPAHSLRAAI